MDEFYSFGRKVIWFPLIGGFVIEKINEGMYKIFKNTTCRIYEMEIRNEQYRKLRKSIKKYKTNADTYKYNLPGLLGLMLNRPFKRENYYFCSQFVATILLESGIFEFEKDPALVTPNDFCFIPHIVPIYEGKLCEYSFNRAKVSAAGISGTI
jgi:hypothetical protein